MNDEACVSATTVHHGSRVKRTKRFPQPLFEVTGDGVTMLLVGWMLAQAVFSMEICGSFRFVRRLSVLLYLYAGMGMIPGVGSDLGCSTFQHPRKRGKGTRLLGTGPGSNFSLSPGLIPSPVDLFL